MKPTLTLSLGAALALGVWVAGLGRPGPTVVTPQAVAPPATAPANLPQAPRLEASALPALPASAPPPSLQGTEADGAWRADARGRLVLERGVRRRFDYWLSTLGEWQPEQIERQVLDQARRELPPTAAQELAQLWTRYLALQRHPWQRLVQPTDPSTWRPALEERQAVRRQRLGREAADVFYAEEEQALWRDILALEAGRPVEAPAAPELPLHPQAEQRLAEVQAQWAAWERRLDEARAEVARLRGAVQLSEPQREQALAQWLAARFSTSEQMRVRALLQLP